MKADKDNDQKQKPVPAAPQALDKADAPVEKGGPKGLEPTRFGDWESNGRCTDF